MNSQLPPCNCTESVTLSSFESGLLRCPLHSADYRNKYWRQDRIRLNKWANCSSHSTLSPDPIHPAWAPPASLLTSPEPTTPDPQPASLARPAGCIVLWRERGGVRGADQIFGSRHPANVQQVNGRTAWKHQLRGHYCHCTGTGNTVLCGSHRWEFCFYMCVND